MGTTGREKEDKTNAEQGMGSREGCPLPGGQDLRGSGDWEGLRSQAHGEKQVSVPPGPGRTPSPAPLFNWLTSEVYSPSLAQ